MNIKEIKYMFWKSDSEFFWIWLSPEKAEEFRGQGFILQGWGEYR